ncbi:MAG TPA: hypothetical protein VK118_02015 [Tetragenococcus sp.]|nr:hypothetical protein [Tetragenococcus sp.]
MVNFDRDFFAGFVSGAIVGATGYKLYEENTGDLQRLVKRTGASVGTQAKPALSSDPSLEELIMQKENLEDLIAEKEVADKKE